ncbi:3alpha(or 20beta)-hydroxysteroid dehydrogenase [Sphingobium faniae]|nr:3alpha(or 20beta)-hydroxysteroid dehydrogenase [Sphingobium faniae]
MQRLEGKTVIVTGAASGMGEADARMMARLGAKVVLTDLQVDKGRAVAADIGSSALFVEHDVSSSEQWKHVIKATVDHFGPMNGLVNNAALGAGSYWDDLNEEIFLKFMRINALSVMLGMTAVVPYMKELGSGSIVNISSTAGKVGAENALCYTAAKFAVTGMTKAAAIDLGPSGIRVNSVHPGATDTPMLAGTMDLVKYLFPRIPLRRLGRPEEVAGLVTFLISDESTYCTGHEYMVDGGMICQQ